MKNQILYYAFEIKYFWLTILNKVMKSNNSYKLTQKIYISNVFEEALTSLVGIVPSIWTVSVSYLLWFLYFRCCKLIYIFNQCSCHTHSKSIFEIINNLLMFNEYFELFLSHFSTKSELIQIFFSPIYILQDYIIITYWIDVVHIGIT